MNNNELLLEELNKFVQPQKQEMVILKEIDESLKEILSFQTVFDKIENKEIYFSVIEKKLDTILSDQKNPVKSLSYEEDLKYFDTLLVFLIKNNKIDYILKKIEEKNVFFMDKVLEFSQYYNDRFFNKVLYTTFSNESLEVAEKETEIITIFMKKINENLKSEKKLKSAEKNISMGLRNILLIKTLLKKEIDFSIMETILKTPQVMTGSFDITLKTFTTFSKMPVEKIYEHIFYQSLQNNNLLKTLDSEFEDRLKELETDMEKSFINCENSHEFKLHFLNFLKANNFFNSVTEPITLFSKMNENGKQIFFEMLTMINYSKIEKFIANNFVMDYENSLNYIKTMKDKLNPYSFFKFLDGFAYENNKTEIINKIMEQYFIEKIETKKNSIIEELVYFYQTNTDYIPSLELTKKIFEHCEFDYNFYYKTPIFDTENKEIMEYIYSKIEDIKFDYLSKNYFNLVFSATPFLDIKKKYFEKVFITDENKDTSFKNLVQKNGFFSAKDLFELFDKETATSIISTFDYSYKTKKIDLNSFLETSLMTDGKNNYLWNNKMENINLKSFKEFYIKNKERFYNSTTEHFSEMKSKKLATMIDNIIMENQTESLLELYYIGNEYLKETLIETSEKMYSNKTKNVNDVNFLKTMYLNIDYQKTKSPRKLFYSFLSIVKEAPASCEIDKSIIEVYQSLSDGLKSTFLETIESNSSLRYIYPYIFKNEDVKKSLLERNLDKERSNDINSLDIQILFSNNVDANSDEEIFFPLSEPSNFNYFFGENSKKLFAKNIRIEHLSLFIKHLHENFDLKNSFLLKDEIIFEDFLRNSFHKKENYENLSEKNKEIIKNKIIRFLSKKNKLSSSIHLQNSGVVHAISLFISVKELSECLLKTNLHNGHETLSMFLNHSIQMNKENSSFIEEEIRSFNHYFPLLKTDAELNIDNYNYALSDIITTTIDNTSFSSNVVYAQKDSLQLKLLKILPYYYVGDDYKTTSFVQLLPLKDISYKDYNDNIKHIEKIKNDFKLTNIIDNDEQILMTNLYSKKEFSVENLMFKLELLLKTFEKLNDNQEMVYVGTEWFSETERHFLEKNSIDIPFNVSTSLKNFIKENCKTLKEKEIGVKIIDSGFEIHYDTVFREKFIVGDIRKNLENTLKSMKELVPTEIEKIIPFIPKKKFENSISNLKRFNDNKTPKPLLDLISNLEKYQKNSSENKLNSNALIEMMYSIFEETNEKTKQEKIYHLCEMNNIVYNFHTISLNEQLSILKTLTNEYYTYLDNEMYKEKIITIINNMDVIDILKEKFELEEDVFISLLSSFDYEKVNFSEQNIYSKLIDADKSGFFELLKHYTYSRDIVSRFKSNIFIPTYLSYKDKLLDINFYNENFPNDKESQKNLFLNFISYSDELENLDLSKEDWKKIFQIANDIIEPEDTQSIEKLNVFCKVFVVEILYNSYVKEKIKEIDVLKGDYTIQKKHSPTEEKNIYTSKIEISADKVAKKTILFFNALIEENNTNNNPIVEEILKSVLISFSKHNLFKENQFYKMAENGELLLSAKNKIDFLKKYTIDKYIDKANDEFKEEDEINETVLNLYKEKSFVDCINRNIINDDEHFFNLLVHYKKDEETQNFIESFLGNTNNFELTKTYKDEFISYIKLRSKIEPLLKEYNETKSEKKKTVFLKELENYSDGIKIIDDLNKIEMKIAQNDRNRFKGVNIKAIILMISLENDLVSYNGIMNEFKLENIKNKTFDKQMELFEKNKNEMTQDDYNYLCSLSSSKSYLLGMFLKHDVDNNILIEKLDNYEKIKSFDTQKYFRCKKFMIDNLDIHLENNDDHRTLNILLDIFDYNMTNVQQFVKSVKDINFNSLHYFNFKVFNKPDNFIEPNEFISTFPLFYKFLEKQESKFDMLNLIYDNFSSIKKELDVDLSNLTKKDISDILDYIMYKDSDLDDKEMYVDVGVYSQSSASVSSFYTGKSNFTSDAVETLIEISDNLKEYENDDFTTGFPMIKQLYKNKNGDYYCGEIIPVIDRRTYGQGYATCSCLTPDGISSDILKDMAKHQERYSTVLISKMFPQKKESKTIDVTMKQLGQLIDEYNRLLINNNNILDNGLKEKYTEIKKIIKENFYVAGAGASWIKGNQATVDNMETNTKKMVKDKDGKEIRINTTDNDIISFLQTSADAIILHSLKRHLLTLKDEMEGKRFSYKDKPLYVTIGSGYSDISLTKINNSEFSENQCRTYFEENKEVYTDAKKHQQHFINVWEHYTFSDNKKGLDTYLKPLKEKGLEAVLAEIKKIDKQLLELTKSESDGKKKEKKIEVEKK